MTLSLSVNDDQLGQFTRKMLAIADRLDKSLPFDKVMNALQCVHDGQFADDQTKTTVGSRPTSSILQPNLIIPATDGKRLLSEATDTFPDWIDPDLTNYGCNVHGEARPETTVDVHEITKNATFKQIFEDQGVPLDQLYLTQAQIEKFVLAHRGYLHPQGYATFFLFKVDESFFVANVNWHDGRRLRVSVYRFSFGSVWGADDRHRVVLPQLALKPSA